MKLIDDTPEADDWYDREPKYPPLQLIRDPALLQPQNLYTFEGVDGAGKTTVLRELVAACRARGRQVLTMRLSGSDIVHHAMQRAKWVNTDPVSINLLNWVSLYDQTHRLRDEYDSHRLIFFDRYTLTVKVRGLVEGQDLAYMNLLEKGIPRPRKVFLLDCDPATCRSRMQRSTRGITYIETGARDVAFDPADAGRLDDPEVRERCYAEHLERVREHYLALAEHESNVIVIDNSGSLDRTLETVLGHLEIDLDPTAEATAGVAREER